MPVLSRRLGELAERLDLERAGVTRVMDTDPKTVSRWLREQTEPQRATRERLLELIIVLEQLSATLQPVAAHDRLFAPNPLLDHDKPADLIRDGQYPRVLGAIDALAENVFL